MNPRTPIEDLRLQGSPNIKRALDRERADGEAPPLTGEQKTEVALLDELIQQCMKACRKGCTVSGRANPAFRQLALLVKTRKEIVIGKAPARKSTEEILAEADRLLGRAN